MPGKKHKPEQIIELLRQIDGKIANGNSISQACKESRISTNTHYRWRRMCLFKGVIKLNPIQQLKASSKMLQRVLRTTERANVALIRRLKRQDYHFRVSSHIVAPRLIRVLEENRKLRIKERRVLLFILRFALGYVSHDELQRHLLHKLPAEELDSLYAHMTGKSQRKRVRALVIVLSLFGVSRNSIADGLCTHFRTVKRCLQAFRRSGVDGVFPRQERVVKWSDPKYREALFCILHSPPKEHGLNRTTWRVKDLASVMARHEMPIGRDRVSAFIKDAGYRYRKARKVLTSNDPNYREKLDHIHQVLSSLKKSERFFSIDEFGPFAVKQQGGRRLVGPGEYPTVPQFQKSKGCLIVTAALELSRNQVTHFYSSGKNTAEMIKILEVLLVQYHDCTRLYFSWDAAGWHASKRFLKKLDEINSRKYRRGHRTPVVEIVPLPARAQFLNVIESIFNGLAISVIHNSDYASLDEAKTAIDRYFSERNLHFQQNPKRAGNKIWGKERVNSTFKEGQNCKSPRY
jgi:transposase